MLPLPRFKVIFLWWEIVTLCDFLKSTVLVKVAVNLTKARPVDHHQSPLLFLDSVAFLKPRCQASRWPETHWCQMPSSGLVGWKMVGTALSLLAPCCKKLAMLTSLSFFLLAPHSEARVQLVGSSSLRLCHSPLKFLHLPATPGTGAMVSYPKPKISDLEMDTDGVC